MDNISSQAILHYTTFTNFSMKYLMMCKVYTDVGGIKQLYHVCPPVHKIIHLLKLVDYLHVQVDNPWYNYYISITDTYLPSKTSFYASVSKGAASTIFFTPLV